MFFLKIIIVKLLKTGKIAQIMEINRKQIIENKRLKDFEMKSYMFTTSKFFRISTPFSVLYHILE